MSPESIFYIVVAAITLAATLYGLVRSTRKEQRDAVEKARKDQDETREKQEKALLNARLDGFNSRNDEVSLLRARLEDRDRDIDRLERQVEMLTSQVGGYPPLPPSRPRPTPRKG